MADSRTEWTTALSHVLLSSVALYSATFTFQMNRGTAAGFLLYAITSALGAAYNLLDPLLKNMDSLVEIGNWIAAVIGFPLLAFGFHWLHGDHSTANLTLVCGLLLAALFHYFTPVNRNMVAQSVTVASSVSTLIISVLAGNSYGILGSVAVTVYGLISVMKVEQLLLLRTTVVLNYVLLAASVAFQKAFTTLNLELS